MEQLLLTIVLAPLAAAILAGLFGRWIGRAGAHTVTILGVATAFGLSVNFNFIAFSHHLGDLAGQVFVFFILTVAAAESAIGLAILVVLFRERRSINVEDLDSMRG